MDETSGVLADAVGAYLNRRKQPITNDQFKLICDYVGHWIQAPCWSDNPEIAALRREDVAAMTVWEVEDLVSRMVAAGIDPF